MALATAQPSGAALPVCGASTDNWVGPNTGTTDWNANSSDWSLGFPTSTSTVCIDKAGTYAVQLTSDAAIGALAVGGATNGAQTLLVETSNLSIAASSAVESGGNLTLESYDDVNLNGSGSLTVAGGGTLATTGVPNENDDPDSIDVPVINQSGGTVSIGAISGGYDTYLSANFTQSPGATLDVTGTFSVTGGTFTESGGTESGNPVQLAGGTLADSGGTGAFDFTSSGSLTGTIPSGQTVSAGGNYLGALTLTLPSAVTDDGNLTLGNYDDVTLAATGSGSLTVAGGGTLSTTGPANENDDPVYIDVPVINRSGGTVSIGAIPGGYDTYLNTGGSFTQSPGAALTVSGVLIVSSGVRFTESGGTESGNPVQLAGGTLADSGGSGAFEFTASSTLSGTIPSGQTVAAGGFDSQALTLTLPSAVTDDGNLTLGGFYPVTVAATGSGSLTVAGGGTLSTTGPANENDDPVYIDVPVINQPAGTMNIGAIPGGYSTYLNTGATVTNEGTLQVANGGSLVMNGGSLANTDTGTLGVTVNGTAGGISGSGVTLDLGSTLAVGTVGSPTSGTFAPISGPVTGTFSLVDWPGLTAGLAYAVSYPSSSVQVDLVPVPSGLPTVTAVSPSFGPASGHTPITVTGTNFTGATGVYFGGIAASNVTVATNGDSLTASSPAGGGVVNVQVANASGNSQPSAGDGFAYGTGTGAVSVSGVSPSAGNSFGGTAVTVTGGGFVGVTAVDFGSTPATDVVVESPTTLTAITPAGSSSVDVTVVTQDFGTSAITIADRFTYGLTVVFTTSVSNVAAGATTSTMTVQLQDPDGNPAPAPSGGQTLSLTSTSAAGTFYAAGSATPITQVVVAAGQSTASFAYTDTVAGTPTITVGGAQTALLDPATTSISVTVDSLTTLVVSPSSATVAVGSSQAFTAEGYDAYGNDLGDQTSTATWSITPSSDGSSCAGATCTVAASGPHTVSATIGSVTGTATLIGDTAPVPTLGSPTGPVYAGTSVSFPVSATGGGAPLVLRR